MGNYVIAVGNYVIVSPAGLGNCKIADNQLDSAVETQGSEASTDQVRPGRRQ
jgi:hypothetical protein